MSKRSYTKLQCIKNEIVQLKEMGNTNREIAKRFGIKERQTTFVIRRYWLDWEHMI